MFKQTACAILFGLVSATAVVAQPEPGLSWGGFGEFHYNDVTYDAIGRQTHGTFDLHRFVLSADYHFDERLSFQGALKMRHALKGTGGEGTLPLSLDRAVINIHFSPKLNLRAGLIPVPVGIMNLAHEPTGFYGVERPHVERYIVPSTWREAGVGGSGRLGKKWKYQLYVMAGLEPSGITGEEGILRARQNGLTHTTGNIALAGRLDYIANEQLTFSASYYLSTLNNTIATDSIRSLASVNAALFNIGEGHVIYRTDRFEARGLFALSRVLDVEDLNAYFGNDVGQIQSGGYVELAYDIYPWFNSGLDHRLYVFGRYESYDTNFVTGKIRRTNEYLRDEITFGFSYKPNPQIVFKLDYQFLTSFVGLREVQQLNAGIGYTF